MLVGFGGGERSVWREILYYHLCHFLVTGVIWFLTFALPFLSSFASDLASRSERIDIRRLLSHLDIRRPFRRMSCSRCRQAEKHIDTDRI